MPDHSSATMNVTPFPHEHTGGNPNFGGCGMDGMDVRVGRLEADTKEVRLDVRDLKTDVHDLRAILANIDGKLSQMPSTWTMMTMVFGTGLTVLALVIGISAWTNQVFDSGRDSAAVQHPTWVAPPQQPIIIQLPQAPGQAATTGEAR
uniref:Uncharacterized protein n=1 Tax=Candidatus Kentrum sp. DK TaxID=2126562 RepID=A0A450TBT1_9GAMM|nr:MAG: hypothetical protein BECKDK2373C_GA0170839_11156 [Candidatus Kentron sp. DK]